MADMYAANWSSTVLISISSKARFAGKLVVVLEISCSLGRLNTVVVPY